MSHVDFTPIVAALWSHVSWVIPALILVAGLKTLLPSLRGRAGEAAVGRALKRRFPEVANDVILPDGRAGLTQIDHLALTPRGILVVETKNYAGWVMGGAREPTWTQVVGRKRSAFQNPLRQNYAHRKAVETLEPGVPVHALVVFAGDAHFPKGIPEGACALGGLDRAVAMWRDGEVTPDLRAAWDRLLQAARTDRGARPAHLDGLRARFGGSRRTRLPAAVALGASVWLAAAWLIRDPGPAASAKAPEPRPAAVSSAPSVLAHPLTVPAPTVLSTAAPFQLPPVDAASTQPQPPTLRQVARKQTANIEWDGAHASDEACALATAALLIDRSTEARKARERACGAKGSAPEGQESSDR